MSSEIDREDFTDADYARFDHRLQSSLQALAELLQRPGIGEGPTTIGAELELCIIDDEARPSPINHDILRQIPGDAVVAEIDRFNLELNTRPVPLAGRPFSTLAADIEDTLANVQRVSQSLGARIVMVGILPTLRAADLQPTALSNTYRFRALSATLRRLRQQPFRVRIDGEDPLDVQCDDVTLEGANTSLQLHLRIAPERFADTYNAAQVAVAPAVAVAGNSPIFLEHRLWQETRIALFRQAVDERIAAADEDWRPARVSFGHGWVRRSALELFAEAVALHQALLPVVDGEDPVACVRAGGIPRLRELRLHHSTVWRWNRAVYDPDAGGHLRLEIRALPSGPSIPDMLANSAFALGLTLGLAEKADWLTASLTFGQARRNFYAAAHHGLDAELLWPSERSPSPRPTDAHVLIPRLIPIARAGLIDGGADAAEVDELLETIASRAERRLTGATWQQRMLATLERRMSRRDALAALVERYLACAASGEPVHCWPLEV
jgi:gamma-glutamyl:cysteine ligase YbdK (ATP-grasp superfamily)